MKNWNSSINGVRFPDCCRECKPPKRHLHCHASCETYLQAKAKFDVEADAERAARRAAAEAKRAEFLMKKG